MIDPEMILEPLNTRFLAGIDVVSDRRDVVINHLLARHALGRKTHVSFFNSNFYVQSVRTNLDYSRLEEFVFLNDGVAANMAARICTGKSFADNLNGTDLIPELLSKLPRGTRVFLFGAHPDVVEKTAKIIARDYDVELVGWLDGYNHEGLEAAERIAETKAEVLLLALGNPLQEQWMADYGKHSGAILTFGVGALFDFMSGEKSRAPLVFRKLRLEWLFRMALEPKRLIKRYTVEMGYFFWLILSSRAGG